MHRSRVFHESTFRRVASTLLVLALLVGTAPFGLIGGARAEGFSAKLELAPAKAAIGDRVVATGTGYPADTDIDLVYHTVKGRYEIELQSEFVGQLYDETTQVLTTVHTDKDGNLEAAFEVPSGFGGPHDIRGVAAGKELSQAGMMVQPTIRMSPSDGPVGTLIEVRIAGVDQRVKVNTWQLLYDSKYLGFASAVTTDGVAVAQFRAAGPVGRHYIQLWNNSWQQTPYMAWDTSPSRDDFSVGQTLTFDVTSDPGLIPTQIDDLSETDNPWPIEQTYAGQLALSVDRGIVGTPTKLTGSGLPANVDVELAYMTMVGDRVSANGWREEPVAIATVTTTADGTLSYDMAIPDDLGGHHRVEASVGGEVVAATGLVVIPSVLSISPTTLKAGEEIEIHLKGLGWTTYDNAYTVTYDNANVGYVCGFSTNGDVVFKVLAVGEPGTHIIDLYPTIYSGQQAMPATYWVPQLTYAQDHPGRSIPAIRMSVEIVE
jgi:hypothetical protein